MKKIILLLTTIFALSLSVFAYHEEKTIEQKFNANKNDILQVIQKYGTVELIEDSETDIVSFKYVITVDCSNEKYGKERFESIGIKFSKEEKTIKAETIFEDIDKNSFFKNITLNISIKATICVPEFIYNDIDIKYGNLVTNKISKDFKCSVKYGNININELNGNKNSLYVGYGKLNLNKAKSIDLEIKYSNATHIGSIDNANIDSKYAELSIESINKLTINSKYDNYTIGNINELYSSIGYTELKINQLNKSLITDDCKYCNITIYKIDKKFDKISIYSSYTPVKLNINDEHSCKFYIATKYASLKNNNDITLHLTSNESGEMKGTIGSSKNPTSELNIVSNYGDIKFINK